MSKNEELFVSGALTMNDYKKHNAYHFKKMMKIYFLVGVFVFFFLFQDYISGTRSVVFIVSLIPSLIISGLLLVFLQWTIRLRASREFKSDQLIKNEISYTFSSGGINQKVRRSNTDYQWNDIIAAYEHEELFQLYISKSKAILLPKRFFSSNEQIDAFKKLVIENIKTKKVKIL